MQDAYETPFDRYRTPFDESQGSVAELDARLDPVGTRLDRIEATLDRMDARFARFERTFRRLLIFSMAWMTVLTVFVYVVGSCRYPHDPLSALSQRMRRARRQRWISAKRRPFSAAG